MRAHGFTYVEALTAVVVLAIAIVPAMNTLTGAVQHSESASDTLRLRYRLLGCMETQLNAPFDQLHASADLVATASTPSDRSDPGSSPKRCLVYLSHYDVDDTDLDGNPFTAQEDDPLWLRVAIPAGPMQLDTLVEP